MKFLKYFLIFALLSNFSFANEQILISENNNKITNIGFMKFLSQDDTTEIQNLFKKYIKYANAHKTEKLKSLYTKDYTNNDGFDKKVFFELINKTWELYEDINYTCEIKNIYLSKNNAIVEVYETAKATTKKGFDKISSAGVLNSNSHTIYYLKKTGKNWQISYDNIIKETTTLKYGTAKDYPITIDAPSIAKEGSEYTISCEIKIPHKTFVIGSITNEPIIYPQKEPKEVFRNIKEDGIIERIVNANTTNHNEYATCAIGITQTSMTGEEQFEVKVVGMSFIMSRVNVLSQKGLK